jgi:hypothetical protein
VGSETAQACAICWGWDASKSRMPSFAVPDSAYPAGSRARACRSDGLMCKSGSSAAPTPPRSPRSVKELSRAAGSSKWRAEGALKQLPGRQLARGHPVGSSRVVTTGERDTWAADKAPCLRKIAALPVLLPAFVIMESARFQGVPAGMMCPTSCMIDLEGGGGRMGKSGQVRCPFAGMIGGRFSRESSARSIRARHPHG